mmetsp:Transcript_20300/g.51968  ORF Transcript_20300/g.51968 Transcript_20300/m.51968 type:complete len:223 (-) Transcript_20300:803-1471(-)
MKLFLCAINAILSSLVLAFTATGKLSFVEDQTRRVALLALVAGNTLEALACSRAVSTAKHLLFAWLAFSCLFILFGAPLQDFLADTLMLALTLTLVTFNRFGVFLTAEEHSQSILDQFFFLIDQAHMNSGQHGVRAWLSVVVSCLPTAAVWAGTIVVPLDWNEPWQVGNRKANKMHWQWYESNRLQVYPIPHTFALFSSTAISALLIAVTKLGGGEKGKKQS